MDFYLESGCCLCCDEAEPGCLCFNCKCKRCEHYIKPSDWDGEKGKCARTIFSKEEKKAYAIKKSLENVQPHKPMKREIEVETIKIK